MIYRVKYCGTDFDLLGPGHKYLGIALTWNRATGSGLIDQNGISL